MEEVLFCEPEYNNKHDPFAVAVRKNGLIVGHVPREFARDFRREIDKGKTITVTVTGRRTNNGRGLVVPGTYLIK